MFTAQMAKVAPGSIDACVEYAERKILDAAVEGHDTMTIHFTGRLPAFLARVADVLKDRGFVVTQDEHCPDIFRVRWGG